MKQHVHEIEAKYKIHREKVKAIRSALRKAGFVHKATNDLVDMWLPPKEKKESLRVREIVGNGGPSQYILSIKKANEKDEGIKNKCESECIIPKFVRDALVSLALRLRSSLPAIRKTRETWEGKVDNRKYTVVIDEVLDLGRFSGHYIEVETLVPFDVEDPKAKPDVRRMALNILSTAYEKEKSLSFEYEPMSYRKMAKIYLAEQDIV